MRHLPWHLVVVGLLCAVLLLANVSLTVLSIHGLQRDMFWVAHTHEVIGKLSRLQKLIVDCQAGVRGYVVTGDSRALNAYRAAWPVLQGDIDALRLLTDDNVRQQQSFPELERLVSTCQQAFERVIESRTNEGPEAATRLVLLNDGTTSMDQLGELTTRMVSHERELLEERSSRSLQTYRIAVLTALLTGVMTLAAMAAFFVALSRHLRSRERFTAAMTAQKEKLRVTLASIGDGVITTDAEGRATNLNGVAEQLTGWKTEDLNGEFLPEVFKIVNEETREPVNNPALRALSEGVIVGLANHTILIARDGSEHPIDDSAAPIRGSHGEIIGSVLVFRDISDRKATEQQLRDREQFTNNILKASPGIVYLYDLQERRTLFISGRSQALLGVNLDQILDAGHEFIKDRVHPEDVPILTTHIQRMMTATNGDAVDVEFRLRHSDGRWLWLISRDTVFLRDEQGLPRQILGVASDMTDRVNAEIKLRDSEAFIRSVLEGSPDGIQVLDSEGRLVLMNARGLRQFEVRNFSLYAGRHWEELWKGIDPRVIHAALDHARATGIGHFQEQTTTVADIETWWDVVVSAVRDAHGRVIRFVCVSRDVSETKRAEAALREGEERFRALADNMSQLAWMADPHGVIGWYNQRWYDYTGTTPADMESLGWQAIHHPDHIDAVVERMQRAWDSGEVWEDTFPLRGHDGEYRWFLSRAIPIRDQQGRVVRWVGTETDITEQQRMADELRRLAADMGEVDRRKSEFLATLAHELRNPLAPLRNMLEILKRQDSDPEILASARETMDRQVSQITRLVDDLLDISRITHNRLELRRETVELASVIHQAVDMIRPAMQAAGHTFELSLPDEVLRLNADAARLTQIFGNLLSNASKYTDPGGHISLRVERCGQEVEIRVRDSGIGLASEDFLRVFEMFAQISTALERTQGGLGIGLAIVKQLVDMHGGSVDVSSEGLGKGSEFRVRLPLQQEVPPVEPAKTGGGPLGATPARRVLVVDDNKDAAMTLSMLLKITGHETCLAHDGLEAVEAAEKFSPHVIMLDIGLPRLNGYEVARRIRAEPWGQSITIVAATGWGQEEDRANSSEAGIDHHLVKPVRFEDLEAILKKLP